MLAMIPPGRLTGDVQTAVGIDSHSLEKPINPANPQLGEIGQRGPQVRRAHGREAQDPPVPAGPAQ